MSAGYSRSILERLSFFIPKSLKAKEIALISREPQTPDAKPYRGRKRVQKKNSIKYPRRLVSTLRRKYQSRLDKDRLGELARLAIACVGARIRRNGLKPFIADIVSLSGMLKDGLASRFFVPKKILIRIGGALAYLVCPADLVADIIPVAGMADDVAVIAYVARSIEELIEPRGQDKIGFHPGKSHPEKPAESLDHRDQKEGSAEVCGK